MKNFFISLMSVALVATAFISCSNDDEPVTKPDDDQNRQELNELAELQENLTVLNEDGSLKERVYGMVLDESKPNTVSVGVENFEEAREIFALLFADTTKISDDGLRAQFSTRQGNAELKADNGNDGLVAHAVFNVDGLKYVEQINFVLHSAWPENAKNPSPYLLGVAYELRGDEDMERFVCIRAYNNGTPALLVAISKTTWYYPSICKISNSPNSKEAGEISVILQANWEYYKKALNYDSYEFLSDNKDYWIEKTSFRLFADYRWTINLKNNKTHRHDILYKHPYYHVLFCIKAGVRS